MFGNIIAWSFIFHETNRRFLTVVFLDVGQGDAIFIESPNGNQVLIDTGPNDSILRVLNKHLPYYDRMINQIITTHPDLDHIGGTPTMIDRYKIEYYSFYKNSNNPEITKKIESLLLNKKVNVVYLEVGDRITIDKEHEIFLDILWPTPKFKSEDKNDLSIITKLIYNDVSFLMTGDASVKIEEFLMKKFNNDELDVDILKLGHHGSKSSSLKSFIEKTSPEKVIVSASSDNKYGHPSIEVIESLEKYFSTQFPDIKINDLILRTSDFGSIVFQSDGEKVWLKN